jgi:hypothetical protein
MKITVFMLLMFKFLCDFGRAMAQAVSLRPPTAEARVRFRVGPCGICGGKSGAGTGFSPSTSGFPCQFHSTGAPLKWKSRKTLIFLVGLHNKPSRLRCVRSICCGALHLKKNIYTILNFGIYGLDLSSFYFIYS